MNSSERNSQDDQFARLLAAHDERLLTGKSKSNEEVSPDLAPRLVQAQAFVELLDEVWRQQGSPNDTPPNDGDSATDPAALAGELPPEVGRFQIVRELGRGGGGVVYLAHDPALGRQVALKVPRLEQIMTPSLRRRFLREGQAAALLNHPNIVPILEAGGAGALCYIVSSYCPGPTLAQWLRDQSELVVSTDAALLIERLAEAMAHAHQRGILHRDLKPSNILLESARVSEKYDTGHHLPLTAYQPKIADFGLAKVLFDAEEATGTGVLLGTAAYMAPEQTRGTSDLGPACDLWALGVIFYEVLTRQKPFPGTTATEIMQAIQAKDPVSPRRLRADLPRDLETICLKCLEKDPEKRYPSTMALAEDLRRFLSDEPIRARPAAFRERVVKWVRRRPSRAALVALTVMLIAVLAGVGIVYDSENRRQERQRTITEQAVTQDLQEAEIFQRDERWAKAIAALERAKGRLEGNGLGELQARVERRRQEAALILRLEEAKLKASNIPMDHTGDIAGAELSTNDRGVDFMVGSDWGLDYSGADQAYQKAFADNGLDIAILAPEDVARQFRASSICPHLVTALDYWAYIRERVHGDAERVRAIARLADDDSWRQQLRDPQVATNREALVRLAEKKDVLNQAPASLLILSYLLDRAEAPAAGAKLLRWAQAKHPGDFWINYELGLKLLDGSGKPSEAVGFLRAALGVQPNNAAVYTSLARALKRPNPSEAVEASRMAIDLRPDYAEAYVSLGNALWLQNNAAETIAAYRKAIELNPNNEMPYSHLGHVLYVQQKLPEAEVVYRKIIAAYPKNAGAHHQLSNIFYLQEKLSEAAEFSRKAIAISPNFANAYNSLGNILIEQPTLYEANVNLEKANKLDRGVAAANWGFLLMGKGEFRQAITSFEQASKHGYTSEFNEECINWGWRWVNLDHKLAMILKVESLPANTAELLALAEFSQLRCRQFYAASAGFYREAFAVDPRVVGELRAGIRYSAALASAKAGCGQGKDADSLKATEYARLRDQSLAWLRADLAGWRSEFEKEPKIARNGVLYEMEQWQRDSAFSGVRGEEALVKLTEAERQKWRKLWGEVEELKLRAAKYK